MKAVAQEYLLRNRDQHWWHVGKHAFVASLLDRLGQESPKVLDIGSSYAFVSGAMAGGARVISLDCDFDVLQKASTACAVCADAVRLPFAPESFDLVTALDLLEHIPDDDGCLREAARALKPGGAMVVMVPAYPILWSDLDEIGRHVRRYTPVRLRRLFEGIPRMDVVKFTHFNALLFPPILMIRLIQRLLKRVLPDLRTESMSIPSRPVNDLLTKAFLLEGRFALSHSLPIGVSLVAVARKRA